MKHEYMGNRSDAAADSVLYELHQWAGLAPRELIDNVQILKFSICEYDEISNSNKKAQKAQKNDISILSADKPPFFLRSI